MRFLPDEALAFQDEDDGTQFVKDYPPCQVACVKKFARRRLSAGPYNQRTGMAVYRGNTSENGSPRRICWTTEEVMGEVNLAHAMVIIWLCCERFFN
jgi:hypothetical protein